MTLDQSNLFRIDFDVFKIDIHLWVLSQSIDPILMCLATSTQNEKERQPAKVSAMWEGKQKKYE